MRRFRIGTRGSLLALTQTRDVMKRLAVQKRWHDDEAEARLELVIVKTSGDRISEGRLADVGGKGLFIKELEEALAAGSIDLAVHSMKDVPGLLPEGFVIAAALPREDARDALLGAASLQSLPHGARLGTTSPRRAAQALSLRPDLKIVTFRGNVDTRLRKLAEGEADATMLAMAGLNRLGLKPDLTPLAVDGFIPAAGQGVVGLEARADDLDAIALAQCVNDNAAAVALTAERTCLAVLDGSCRSAIAIHAHETSGGFDLRAAVFAPDGSRREEGMATRDHVPSMDQAAALGRALGEEIRRRAGALIG